MFGLEKENSNEKKFFFDLELEIKDNPTHGQELVEKAEKKSLEIKKILREGANEKEFDQWGVLLHGYTALQKVLKKARK